MTDGELRLRGKHGKDVAKDERSTLSKALSRGVAWEKVLTNTA